MKRVQPSVLILPIILAGGEGRRLAPISTSSQPKPFIPLPDGRSLLTRTLERASPLNGFLPPLLIGQASHRFSLLNHARAAHVVPSAILLEPQAKNTAMAIASACLYALHYQPQAVLAILPADQVIEPQEAWLEAVHAAAAVSHANGKLCLLGVTPTRPDPHFGYIQPGLPLPGSEAVLVEQFIEKPEYPAALLPHCFWNAGQFFVTPAILAQLFAAHAPDIWEAAREAMAAADIAWEFTMLGSAAYISAPPRSFDRSIVEKSSVLAVRLQAHWHDLGTVEAWEAYTCQPADSYADRPERIDRPWGFYELLGDKAPDRLEKRLTLFPGCRISLQRHTCRDEEWRVLSGQAEAELDGQFYRLEPGSHIHIMAHMWHRLHNTGSTPLIIHEIQSGNPDESDIERREDDYGRLNDS